VHTTIDFETSNFDKGSPFNDANIPVCVCLSVDRIGGGRGVRSPHELFYHFLDSSYRNCTWDHILSTLGSTTLLIAHQIKFELHWLYRLGVAMDCGLYDTMFGGFIERGSSKTHSLSLSSLTGAKEALGDLLVHEHALNPAELPPKWMITYCLQDVRITRLEAHAQWERLGIDYSQG
jgi:hypothetical protein